MFLLLHDDHPSAAVRQGDGWQGKKKLRLIDFTSFLEFDLWFGIKFNN